MIRKSFQWLTKLASHDVEILTQLLLVFAAGITYGILEAFWIPTSTMNATKIPYIGHFAYYHICLIVLMAVASFSLAINQLQWILLHRVKYPTIMGIAGMPLSLLIEDIVWFIANKQPIRKDEWTMIWPGAGFNFFNLTYIPFWYIVVVLISGGLYWWANRLAESGYQRFLRLQKSGSLVA